MQKGQRNKQADRDRGGILGMICQTSVIDVIHKRYDRWDTRYDVVSLWCCYNDIFLDLKARQNLTIKTLPFYDLSPFTSSFTEQISGFSCHFLKILIQRTRKRLCYLQQWHWSSVAGGGWTKAALFEVLKEGNEDGDRGRHKEGIEGGNKEERKKIRREGRN